MIFEDKQITLKDGRIAIFKSPSIEDAAKLLYFIKKSCGETDFLVRYPEEYQNMTIAQEEAWVNSLRSSPNILGITCYVDGEVVGNSEISFRRNIKTSHRATIAIAILKDYWNLGIGSAMLEKLVAAAQKTPREQLHNQECWDRFNADKYLAFQTLGCKTQKEPPDGPSRIPSHNSITEGKSALCPLQNQGHKGLTVF